MRWGAGSISQHPQASRGPYHILHKNLFLSPDPSCSGSSFQKGIRENTGGAAGACSTEGPRLALSSTPRAAAIGSGYHLLVVDATF